MNIWIVLGAAVAAVAVAAPVVAIILVSLASLSEESAHSLAGQAPGLAERAARRLLGFHTEVSRPDAPGPASPGQPAGRQSQPSAVSLDQRQGAGV